MPRPSLLLPAMLEACLAAGREILEVYRSPFRTMRKADATPLTEADLRAHRSIAQALAPSRLPVLSEEGSRIPIDKRRRWERFWLVDPLDGTKEFVRKNGEFTVNIALISRGSPIAGAVYAPVPDLLYWGIEGGGAFRLRRASRVLRRGLPAALALAEKLPVAGRGRPFTIVASRSHLSPETAAFIREQRKRRGKVRLASSGSSLKFCLVAQGSADLYPRLSPTMEWDTAAGHAVAAAAGRTVALWPSGEPLIYNKRNLRNGWFLVS